MFSPSKFEANNLTTGLYTELPQPDKYKTRAYASELSQEMYPATKMSTYFYDHLKESIEKNKKERQESSESYQKALLVAEQKMAEHKAYSDKIDSLLQSDSHTIDETKWFNNPSTAIVEDKTPKFTNVEPYEYFKDTNKHNPYNNEIHKGYHIKGEIAPETKHQFEMGDNKVPFTYNYMDNLLVDDKDRSFSDPLNLIKTNQIPSPLDAGSAGVPMTNEVDLDKLVELKYNENTGTKVTVPGDNNSSDGMEIKDPKTQDFINATKTISKAMQSEKETVPEVEMTPELFENLARLHAIEEKTDQPQERYIVNILLWSIVIAIFYLLLK